jgi:hypothetical protein
MSVPCRGSCAGSQAQKIPLLVKVLAQLLDLLLLGSQLKLQQGDLFPCASIGGGVRVFSLAHRQYRMHQDQRNRRPSNRPTQQMSFRSHKVWFLSSASRFEFQGHGCCIPARLQTRSLRTAIGAT